MYQDLLYTPVQDKYKATQWSANKDRSQVRSQLNKSSSAYRSTEVGSHSPYRSTAVSRLDQAKRTIDSVIVDLQDQRDMNSEGFREVRSVHSDFLDGLRKGFHYDKENSQVGYQGFSTPQGSSYDFRVKGPQDQDVVLRSRLNEEMRKNNDLMMRMSRMEEENRMMKQDYQRPGDEMWQLKAQNERLKRALSQASSLPQQVFSQLQELKRENQQLRRDTVKLLKKVDHII